MLGDLFQLPYNDEAKKIEPKEKKEAFKPLTIQDTYKGDDIVIRLKKISKPADREIVLTEDFEDTVIMIGNPGVGKSTLLNGLVGSVQFKAGISYGKGITTVLQEQIQQGRRYIDTPGLSDIKMREQAAKEITKALKEGGIFRIFFVLTLEAGRIKPDDKTTMQLVLEAAPEIGSKYSIIINKASKKVKGDMQTKKYFDTIAAMLNESLSGTMRIFVNTLDLNLDDEDNKLPILSPDFLKFFWEAPLVAIQPVNVKTIEADRFEKIREKFSQEISQLEKDKRLLKQKIEEQNTKFDQIKRDFERSRGEVGKLKHQSLIQERAMNDLRDEAEELKEELYEKINKLKTDLGYKEEKSRSEIKRLRAEVEKGKNFDCLCDYCGESDEDLEYTRLTLCQYCNSRLD